MMDAPSVQSLIADLLSPAQSPPMTGDRGEKGENPRHCWTEGRANRGESGAKKGEFAPPALDARQSTRASQEHAFTQAAPGDRGESAENSPFFAPDSPAFAPASTRAIAEDSPFSPRSPVTSGDCASPDTYRCWSVTRPDGAILSVTRCPPSTRAEMERDHPGAHLAPIPEPTDAPPALHPEDEALAFAYLRHIGEQDTGTGMEWLAGLARDPARLTALYEEVVRLGLATDEPEDDRRPCRACLNLASGGDCLSAKRGELPGTSRFFGPSDPDARHRCIRYLPGQSDSDKRPGADRWPWSNEERFKAKLPPKIEPNPYPIPRRTAA